MSDVLIVDGFTRQASYDRRGRVFVDAHFIDYETEVDTFRALAKKYLKGALKEVTSRGVCHPVFAVDMTPYEPSVQTYDDWGGKAVLLPAQQAGS
ncbi:hypothetical protein [Pseudomonas sp. BNK-15]|uniref:hypothetical protein n=1 Tax=Pseudomonas sp. BNK-15 TaxID=3376152 RepID=UPI0039BEE08F